MTTPTKDAARPAKPEPKPLAPVELTREELSFLLVHVQTQFAELERVMGGLEEEEGESITKWNLKRTLGPQMEMLGDLSSKLEGAARDARWR